MDGGAVVGAGWWCSGSVVALRRLMAAKSTTYDFVDRQIFITSSASAWAFDVRLPSMVLCT